jgi:hypothetical protein
MLKTAFRLPVSLLCAASVSSWGASLALDALSSAQVTALVAASDFSGPPPRVGPPSSARFLEPGPITVSSGQVTDIYRGPGKQDVNALLFLLSSYQNPAGSKIQVNTLSATSSSSFSGVFNFNVNGIANGMINNIRLTDSQHIGVLLRNNDNSSLSGLLGNTTDADIGDFAATLAAGMAGARVDVFGVTGWGGTDAQIVNVTPNSGGVGVGVPEPSSVLASLAAGAGLLALRRKIRA